MDEQALLGLLGGTGGGSQYSPTMRPTGDPILGNSTLAAQGGGSSGGGGDSSAQTGNMGLLLGGGSDAGAGGGNSAQNATGGAAGGDGNGGAFYQDQNRFRTTMAQNSGLFPAVFSDKAPPAGWFTMDDYWRLSGPPAADNNAALPWKWQSGSSLPSTNDWRLLPEGFRSPEFFMFNGEIINRNEISPSISKGNGQEPPFTGYNRGDSLGYPIAFTLPGWSGGQSFFGYPGSMGGWHSGNPNGG